MLRVEDGEVTAGELPGKDSKLVQAWIEILRDKLLANWELCQNGEKPFTIEPLK